LLNALFFNNQLALDSPVALAAVHGALEHIASGESQLVLILQ
jgi:hypothetical protein